MLLRSSKITKGSYCALHNAHYSLFFWHHGRERARGCARAPVQRPVRFCVAGVAFRCRPVFRLRLSWHCSHPATESPAANARDVQRKGAQCQAHRAHERQDDAPAESRGRCVLARGGKVFSAAAAWRSLPSPPPPPRRHRLACATHDLALADVEKSFTFDFSYNSHNRDDADFAGQEDVYRDLGVGVLNNAFDGASPPPPPPRETAYL